MNKSLGTMTEALRRIPSLDAFLRRDGLGALPRPLVLRTSRLYLAELRERVRGGQIPAAELDAFFASAEPVAEVVRRCERARELWHRRVINATGIVLHTGIGRAPLARAASEAAMQASGYAVVEVDPASGARNQREQAVAELLTELCGVTGALVVNNNAAATTLVLAAVAAGREVVVSRGQLVEIGGGFRMPDVMAQAGCRMVEVGTTNRTHLADYRRALGEATAAIAIVHPSNFRVVGFTATPDRAELVELARSHDVALIEDLGSGFLVRQPIAGLESEPHVADVVAAGGDLTCFSGDKLLGGPQCGIIVGDRSLVARVRSHPLYRAIRCDKLTLSSLEATLRIYRDGDPLAEIPTLHMLVATEAHLRVRAEALAEMLGPIGATVVASEAFAGSGANPARPLASAAVAIDGGDDVAAALRRPSTLPSIIARLDNNRVLLDLRTLEIEDLDEVAEIVRARLSDPRPYEEPDG